MIYVLDIQKPVEAKANPAFSIETGEEVSVGSSEADCATLISAVPIKDATTGRPHWGPTPGVQLLAQVDAGGNAVGVLVVPHRPGCNLVNTQGTEIEVGPAPESLVPASARLGSSGTWAVVDLPEAQARSGSEPAAGSRRLRMGHRRVNPQPGRPGASCPPRLSSGTPRR